MARGVIKWFNLQKGYGFITRGGDSDVFLHYSGLAADTDRHLYPGERVEFDLAAGDKGPKAINVARLDPPFAPEGNGV
jgi:CspA family cold shock protein